MDIVMAIKKDSLFLVALFFISLSIRVFVYQYYLSKDNKFWQVDSLTYHLVAQGISEGKGISLPTGQANFYRLPGYPLFVALFYKIVGPQPQKFLWAQVVLGACIPLLIFYLSLTLFPGYRLLAYGASLYSSFHLGFVLYSGFFMTETLCIFFLLLFFIFFFKYIHLWFCKTTRTLRTYHFVYHPTLFLPDPLEESVSFTHFYEKIDRGDLYPTKQNEVQGDAVFRSLVFAGLFLGLASLIRPVGHYLLLLSLGIILACNDSLYEKIKKIMILFVSWLLPTIGWLVRNYLLLGHIFFHTLPGGHFLYLSAARVAMFAQDTTYAQARVQLNNEVNILMRQQETAHKRPLNEIERCYAHETIARNYFWRYPLITFRVWATDIFRTCFSLYSAELLYLESGRKDINYFDKERTIWSLFKRYLFPPTDNWFLKIVIYLEIIFYLFILCGFVGGLWSLAYSIWSKNIDRDILCSWAKAIPFMMLFVIIALAGGYARMRLPIEPLLIILSWWWWITAYKYLSSLIGMDE